MFEDQDQEEDNLEGLDVDLGDMRQIPPLIDDMMSMKAERVLMQEEGHRPRCRGSSREDEDEALLVSNLLTSAIARDEL